MICPTCNGFGWIGRRHPVRPGMTAEPCPQCMGSKLAHCCEGDQWSEREKEVERGQGRQTPQTP